MLFTQKNVAQLGENLTGTPGHYAWLVYATFDQDPTLQPPLVIDVTSHVAGLVNITIGSNDLQEAAATLGYLQEHFPHDRIPVNVHVQFETKPLNQLDVPFT